MSVPALLETELALPMGQLFLDVLGKKGMLTVWSLIIVVQVRFSVVFMSTYSEDELTQLE